MVMRGSSPLMASKATLALNAGEWLRLGLLGIVHAPPWSCASEQYHLSGYPISPGHFSGRNLSELDGHIEEILWEDHQACRLSSLSGVIPLFRRTKGIKLQTKLTEDQ